MKTVERNSSGVHS